jgi:hypothetical protein
MVSALQMAIKPSTKLFVVSEQGKSKNIVSEWLSIEIKKSAIQYKT